MGLALKADPSAARAPSGHVGADCDYVIVGSGAGGGTLAARLAEAGCEVVLLEAGGDPRQAGQSRLPEDYDVPAFHPFATENSAIGWNFFVHHYGEEKRQRLDPKYRAQWNGRDVGGIFYPRAATLGGCTAHNAMIFVYPHNADWDGIAALTGDKSWSAGNMRRYVARLENCHHRPFWRWLRWLGLDSTGHGWSGWLHTEKAIPREALRDERLMRTLLSSALTILGQSDRPLLRLRWMLLGGADPNDARLIRENAEGVCYTPLSTHHHRRIGARERVLDVARRYPQRLRIKLHALATRVLFDDSHRAIGIEYLKGEHLYRADARPDPASGEKREVRARREVILAGGAFNTPQLLMLSGIGPRATLQRHGIPVRVDRSGVGQNLQDRYEISVVNRMAFPHWRALAGARFAVDDPLFERWANSTSGMYTSNGAVLSLRLRSEPARSLPDLFLMALMSRFEGYFPGYSRLLPDSLNYLTWVVLKAHTNNCAGEVTLRSADPRDPPLVNFCYFDEGSDTAGHDLRAVVGAIRFVRKVAAPLRRLGWIAEETFPGQHLQSDDELAEVVRNQAWGHHAACSCAIGPMERNGVLDSAFRVYGVQGLRVVDASAFPQLPGFFPVSAIYMIGEKAADVILADVPRPSPPG